MLCAVCGCNNYNNKTSKLKREDISYYHFPKDPKLLKIWISFCRRKDGFNTKTARICSDHFTPDDMESNLQFELGLMKKKRYRLKRGSIPTVYKITKEDDPFGRKSRIVARNNKEIVKNLLLASTNRADSENEDVDVDAVDADVDEDDDDEEEEYIDTNDSIESDAEMDPIDLNTCTDCVSMKKYLNELNLQLLEMEERCNRLVLSEAALKEKVKSLELELGPRPLQKNNNVNSTEITPMCTKLKIKKIELKEVKQQRWTHNDINSSKTFYSANSKAYNLMRKNGVVLPSERTLQRWAKKKRDQSRGIVKPVVTSLQVTTKTDIGDKVLMDC